MIDVKRYATKNGPVSLGGLSFFTSHSQEDVVEAYLYTFLKATNGKTSKEEMDYLFFTLTEQQKADMLYDYDGAVKGGRYFSEYTGERYYDKHLDNEKGDN